MLILKITKKQASQFFLKTHFFVEKPKVGKSN